MLIGELANLRGVTGGEGPVRAFLRDKAAPLADKVYNDRLGNLFAHIEATKPGAPHLMVCAHMDEVGFAITGFAEQGLIKFAPVGGIDARTVVSKRVLVGEKAVPGVIGAKAIHLQERGEMNKPLTYDKLLIDVGAAGKAEAQGLVEIGDLVTFDTPFEPFGDGFLRGKALDDRAGCAMLLELLKKRYPVNVTAAFTVQEEVGMRGAGIAAFGLKPDACLVLETTTANDTAGVEKYEQVCTLGQGPAISVMDRSVICDPELVKKLVGTAREHGIPHQMKRSVAGGTDAGAVSLTRAGVKCAVVSTPCRYLHSPVGVIKQSDWEAGLALMERFLSSC